MLICVCQGNTCMSNTDISLWYMFFIKFNSATKRTANLGLYCWNNRELNYDYNFGLWVALSLWWTKTHQMRRPSNSTSPKYSPWTTRVAYLYKLATSTKRPAFFPPKFKALWHASFKSGCWEGFQVWPNNSAHVEKRSYAAASQVGRVPGFFFFFFILKKIKKQ